MQPGEPSGRVAEDEQTVEEVFEASAATPVEDEFVVTDESSGVEGGDDDGDE